MTLMRAAQRPQMSSERVSVSSAGPICGAPECPLNRELVTRQPESWVMRRLALCRAGCTVQRLFLSGLCNG